MGTTIQMLSARVVTAGELERMPRGNYRYELVEGRLVRMSPVGLPHGIVTARLLVMLDQYVTPRRLGVVVTELGVILRTAPDTVRAPDVAFIRGERIAAAASTRGFWSGAPDLAVEVLSPDDRQQEMAAKVAEYLATGTQVVWVVDPEERTIIVHRRGAPSTTLGINDTLDGGVVLPEFACRVSEIFDTLV